MKKLIFVSLAILSLASCRNIIIPIVQYEENSSEQQKTEQLPLLNKVG